jgi:hypothetical protein
MPACMDGTVLSSDQEAGEARVIVRGGSRGNFEIRLPGVASLTDHGAEGMTLYAIAEMQTEPLLRRIVFAN